MYRYYIEKITVTEADMDMQGRVSNLRYVQWMQDLAVAHSAANGWSMERYAAVGQGWVVRQHRITYRKPAVAGQVISGTTWVADFASRQCTRRYLFWRGADAALLAEAETLWIYIDYASGRPVRIPEELSRDFAAAEEAEVRAALAAG